MFLESGEYVHKTNSQFIQSYRTGLVTDGIETESQSNVSKCLPEQRTFHLSQFHRLVVYRNFDAHKHRS